MILSHKQIEEIAAGVMQDFFKFFFGDDFDEGMEPLTGESS